MREHARRHEQLYPLHVTYKGSQLAFALSYLKSHKNVRLVSLMIGANDFFVCEETTKDACASSAEQSVVAATVTKNIHTILFSIHNKAHYKGQLAIVNYYSPDYASATDDAQSTGAEQRPRLGRQALPRHHRGRLRRVRGCILALQR
jgi:lysophospholipase L1-like esterase